mmetsp:Transcript_41213/g.87677  ORF Transcript_41213/g.87677 Transcript_41213/m.87677 type:complete len:300 (+) Transcript_41213:223-1122(+)
MQGAAAASRELEGQLSEDGLGGSGAAEARTQCGRAAPREQGGGEALGSDQRCRRDRIQPPLGTAKRRVLHRARLQSEYAAAGVSHCGLRADLLRVVLALHAGRELLARGFPLWLLLPIPHLLHLHSTERLLCLRRRLRRRPKEVWAETVGRRAGGHGLHHVERGDGDVLRRHAAVPRAHRGSRPRQAALPQPLCSPLQLPHRLGRSLYHKQHEPLRIRPQEHLRVRHCVYGVDAVHQGPHGQVPLPFPRQAPFPRGAHRCHRHRDRGHRRDLPRWCENQKAGEEVKRKGKGGAPFHFCC